MSITKYKAFLKVIEYGSITKAADYMGYTQPGISHMITSLEKQSGFSLLIRSKDKVEPTENAKLLIPFYQQIVAQNDYANETINSINNINTGTIRITAYNSILLNWLPKIIKHFTTDYPNISFQMIECDHIDACKRLINNYSDMAFMIDDIPNGFDFIRLYKDEIKVILPPGHPLCEKETINFSDIDGYDFLMPLPGYDDHLKNIRKYDDFTPNIKHYIGSDNAFMSMVANGLGIAILPETIISVSAQDFVAKSFSVRHYRSLGIAIRSKSNTSPAIKAFIAAAEKVSASLLH